MLISEGSELIHGQRKAYGYGCRCQLCRDANAAYQKAYYRAKSTGRLVLGAKVSAVETWRKIRQLKSEHFIQAEIARRLGRHDTGHLFRQRDVITLRNALRVQRLCRELLIQVSHESICPSL